MSSIYFSGLNNLQLYANMTIRIHKTINKYIYVLLGICCFCFSAFYTYTIYSLDVGVQNNVKVEMPRDKNIMTSLRDKSVGEAGSVKLVDVHVESHSKLQSTASLPRRVDPMTLSRVETEQILRDDY